MTTDPSRVEPRGADRSTRSTDSGTSTAPPRLGLTFDRGVPVLALDENANIEGLRASIKAHLPGHQSAIGRNSVRLDLGAREINLFDLRRVVHTCSSRTTASR
jgi:hypothetical protein